MRWGTGPEVTGKGQRGPSTTCRKTEIDLTMTSAGHELNTVVQDDVVNLEN